jgi:hypothetical protein
VQTDRAIPNDKLDTRTHDNEKGICMSADVAISGDTHVIKNKSEKILKYK